MSNQASDAYDHQPALQAIMRDVEQRIAAMSDNERTDDQPSILLNDGDDDDAS